MSTGFNKKILPEIKNSYQSQLHQTIISNQCNTLAEEEQKIYLINFSDEIIENSRVFQIEVPIPLEYTINQSFLLIVGVLNRTLKAHNCKLNPNAKYQLYQSRKNGKPKLDLPSFLKDFLY